MGPADYLSAWSTNVAPMDVVLGLLHPILLAAGAVRIFLFLISPRPPRN